jgi:Holliday junction DNA helicase RuvB
MRGFQPAPLVGFSSPDEEKLFYQYLAEEKAPTIILPEGKAKTVLPLDLFSPQSFDEYIGQNEAKELSRIMVQAAHNERRPLPNVMMVGEYGLGKTALARLIIRAAGLPERLYDGSSLNKEFPEPGTFIIDEIHNLDPQTADSLNLKLDSGEFHIIGCTNNPGNLPSAFRSRFRNLQLHSYTSDELEVIITKICVRKKIQFNENAIRLLAMRSRFNARQAIMYLSLVFDIMSVKGAKTLNLEVINETLNHLGIDNRSLLPRDREYLQALPVNKPVGLQFLSAVLGIDEKTIEEEVEPFLLRMGFIDRTPRGRILIEG